MDRSKNKTIFNSFSCEEIQSYAEELEEEQLEDFVIGLERFNLELEESVNKRMAFEKNKRINLDLLLRRVWLRLGEKERKELAGFFDEMHKRVSRT